MGLKRRTEMERREIIAIVTALVMLAAIVGLSMAAATTADEVDDNSTEEVGGVTSQIYIEIPEFSTIAIPLVGILVLFLFFNHRKRE